MGVIYLKELRSYFKSFFGWLFLAVFTAFCSLFFVIYNIRYGNPYLSTTVNSLVIILMFVFPLLTMRVLSEEKKLKTDQLILTSPVSVTSVVMGKFFALVTMMCLASLVLLVGLLIMSFYGSIPVPQNLMAVLALVLMGSVFASIGIFFSSLRIKITITIPPIAWVMVVAIVIASLLLKKLRVVVVLAAIATAIPTKKHAFMFCLRISPTKMS